MVGAAFGVGPAGGSVIIMFALLAALILLYLLRYKHTPTPKRTVGYPANDLLRTLSDDDLDVRQLVGKVITKEAELSQLRRALTDREREALEDELESEGD